MKSPFILTKKQTANIVVSDYKSATTFKNLFAFNIPVEKRPLLIKIMINKSKMYTSLNIVETSQKIAF